MTDQIDGVEPDDVLSADSAGGEQEADQTTDQAEGEEGEPEDKPEPKPKKTAQDRINELTRKAREAEREREYWREAALNGPKAPTQRAAPEQPREAAPHPDDFKYGDADPNYLVALAKHEAKREIRQEFEAREQSSRLSASLSTFDEKVAELFPAGEPEGLAALRSLPAIRSEITDVIFTSDKGPLIAEHLGDNPSALRRLEGLPAHLVGFELAKIEQALSAPPPPNRVTKAPDPAPKPRGSGGQFTPDLENCDFATFEKFAAKVRSS